MVEYYHSPSLKQFVLLYLIFELIELVSNQKITVVHKFYCLT